jgi:Ca2+-binding EF-hand superfamily protein
MTRILMVGTALVFVLGAQVSLAQGPRGGPDFGTLDTDGNGQLTQSELAAAADARFGATDTNGDGVLSRDEIINQSRKNSERRAERMIERLDSDGDGALSQAELQSRRDPARMFARIDANSDGVITEDEFEDGRKKMRKRMKHNRSNDG